MPHDSHRIAAGLLPAAAAALLFLSANCSHQDAAPTAPALAKKSFVLRLRRTDGVAGSPAEDSIVIASGDSVHFAYRAAPGYVSVSAQLDSVPTANSGTIRMTSSHLLAVGATPIITSAPRDSALATTLAGIPGAVNPRGAFVSASQGVDAFARTAGIAGAIQNASNAVALVAGSPLSLAMRLRADSALWDLWLPVPVRDEASGTRATSMRRIFGRSASRASIAGAAITDVPVDIIYIDAIRPRYEKFLAEVPAFQAIVRGANLSGDVGASVYYTRTAAPLGDAMTRADCDASTLIDALESRADYVDMARRFGHCLGADPAPTLRDIATALAPGLSPADASGAAEHVRLSLRAGRGVILFGYSQGALAAREAIHAIKNDNDLSLDAGNCIGFMSVASPSYAADDVAPGLIAGTIASGGSVRDLMSYLPGAKASGAPTELSAKYDAEAAALYGSSSLLSAHELWSAYHLHDFAQGYEGSAAATGFVQSKLHDIATALRARCGIGRELAASRSAVALSTLLGETPAATSIVLSNAGVGTITGLSSIVSYSSGQPAGWLNAALDSTTTPATLTLSAAPSSLPSGLYSATVTVRSSNAAVKSAPLGIVVTLAVGNPPALAVDATSLNFSVSSGSISRPAQLVHLTNTGGGDLGGLSVGAVRYISGPGNGWLSATLDHSTAPATVTVSVDLGEAAVGQYTAAIPVGTTQNGVTGASQAITVFATVAAVPASFTLSATTLAFSAQQNGAASADQTIQVRNVGQVALTGLTLGSVSYSSGDVGWLRVSLSGTTAPATVTVGVNAGALRPGTYMASVSLTSSASNFTGSPRTITVTVTVTAAPILALSSFVPLAFVVTNGDACPTSTSPVFSVSNNGGGTLNGLSVTATYPGGTAAWLSTSLSGTTAPATVNAGPSCAAYSLAPGTYAATVSVSSTAAAVTNGPQSVAASLVVSPRSTPTTGSLAVSMSGLPAGYLAPIHVQSNTGQATVSLASGQSTTLTNLVPNQYDVVPYTVGVLLAPGYAEYGPTILHQSVNVSAGATASVGVTYTLKTGYMRVSATGIPIGCSGSYSFSGTQNGGSGPIPSGASVFIASIAAESYTVSFGPVQGPGCTGSTLHAASVTVTVAASTATTAATGAYVP